MTTLGMKDLVSADAGDTGPDEVWLCWLVLPPVLPMLPRLSFGIKLLLSPALGAGDDE